MLSDSKVQELTNFLLDLNLSSDNLALVNQGLTHPSYINENNLNVSDSYERLEFLGDAVLKLIASRYLYNKFPDYDEGKLTTIRSILVSDMYLEKFASEINLIKYLVLGTNESKAQDKIPSSIQACAFEGLLGALYLSGDFEKIYLFLENLLEPVIADIDKNSSKYNAKALLQEYTQGLNKDLPEYVLKKESGPEHAKIFETDVFYRGEHLGSGSGKTKKEAQQSAAIAACERLGLFNE